MIKLIGIAVVAAGFALRLNPLLVVVAAGVATGLAAGLSFQEVMTLFGTFFVDNRFMTLPVVLMLPVVGIIDSSRAQDIMTAVLRSISESRARVFIMDISGVPVVDTMGVREIGRAHV